MFHTWMRYFSPNPVHHRLGLVCLGVGYVAGTALDTWWHERRPAARRVRAAGPAG